MGDYGLGGKSSTWGSGINSANGSDQFFGIGIAGFGIANEGFVDDGGEVFSSPGIRSRMGTGFSFRMMSMGSRLGSKR